MITMEQIKAARALLDWNQADLAKAAAISKPALANLERGTAQPRMETLNAITRALEEGGIEFTDGQGVRLRGEVLNVQVFEGKNALQRLWSDTLETLSNGGERLISGVDERIFERLAKPEEIRKIIEKFNERGITNRILSREGDGYLIESPEQYRWIPQAFFSNVPFYVYGNKYAILITEPSARIVLIENKAIADSYRQQFEVMWKNGKMPSTI